MIRRIVPVLALLVIALAALSALPGCAPEDHVNMAKRTVESARSVHADYLAPYEFASAEEYLRQAIVELHESDFSSASTYATKSRAMAQQAETKAREAHAKPMAPWTPEAAPAAPPPPPAAVAPKTPPPPAAVAPKPSTPPAKTPSATPPPKTPPGKTPPATPPGKTPPGAQPPPLTPPVPPPPPKKKVSDEYPLGEPEDDQSTPDQGGSK
jgi:hypothetical protein